MKHFSWIMVALLALTLSSCASSDKAKKSPIKTFVMPCSQLKSGDGVLRAWAVGKSDSENTARKKAQTAAAAELATMLKQVVNKTAEEYSATIQNGDHAESTGLLKEKVMVTVNETLQGAVVVCDEWTRDEATGQYANYITLELQGEEFLKKLFEKLGNNNNVNQEQLRKLLLQQIEKAGKE